jgi:hypothetical protein
VFTLHSHAPVVVSHESPVIGHAAQAFPPEPHLSLSRLAVRQVVPSQHPFAHDVVVHWHVAAAPDPTHSWPTAQAPPVLPHTHWPLPLHRLTRVP